MGNQQQSKHRIGGYQAGQRPAQAIFHQIGRFLQQQLPPRVDLRKYMTDVEEQIGNSCVANAFVGAYEYLAKRDLGESGEVSRLFVYYNARARQGYQQEDCGTQMYCAIESLREYGACSEACWPNDEALLCEEPYAEAYEHGAYFKIVEAEYLETNLNLWKHTLAEGYPIAFALNTFESFDEATRSRGRVPMPKQSDNVRETHGWHAMLCVGYSDKDRMFIVRNSWGNAWGDRGYAYIPYDYIMHQDYNAHDSWIIKSLSDLDFSADVWEDDESFFADENSLLLYDFYVCTNEPDSFVEALDALCQEYVESEEDYYFDYEMQEDEDSWTVTILNFDLTIDDAEEFLENLDTLCQNYTIDENYSCSLDGEVEETDEEASDEEESDEEIEASDEEESDEESEEEESEEEWDEEIEEDEDEEIEEDESEEEWDEEDEESDEESDEGE